MGISYGSLADSIADITSQCAVASCLCCPANPFLNSFFFLFLVIFHPTCISLLSSPIFLWWVGCGKRLFLEWMENCNVEFAFDDVTGLGFFLGIWGIWCENLIMIKKSEMKS